MSKWNSEKWFVEVPGNEDVGVFIKEIAVMVKGLQGLSESTPPHGPVSRRFTAGSEDVGVKFSNSNPNKHLAIAPPTSLDEHVHDQTRYARRLHKECPSPQTSSRERSRIYHLIVRIARSEDRISSGSACDQGHVYSGEISLKKTSLRMTNAQANPRLWPLIHGLQRPTSRDDAETSVESTRRSW